MKNIQLVNLILIIFTFQVFSFDQRLISTRFDLLCKTCLHGSCLLEKCICNPGWYGDNCNLSMNEEVPNCIDISCERGFEGLVCKNNNPTDACHYHPEYGVLKVPNSRWKQSQVLELMFWENHDLGESDANGLYFDHYKSLPGDLGHIFEFGAGPYTQTKNILEIKNSKFKSLTILEPQVLQYITNVSGCAYKNGTLYDRKVSFIISPAENVMLGEVFDTVIMINTIEHVENAIEVLRSLYHSIKPGGLLIFHEAAYENYKGEPYTYHKDIKDFIFHPIRIKEAFLNWFLSHFEQIHRNNIDYVRPGNTSIVEARHIYFIGRKPVQDIGWKALMAS